MAQDFLTAKETREWSGAFQILNEENLQSRTLDPGELLVKYQGGLKKCPDMQAFSGSYLHISSWKVKKK